MLYNSYLLRLYIQALYYHFVFLKGTQMQIWKSTYMFYLIHTKIIPWKFRILNPKNSRVIPP